MTHEVVGSSKSIDQLNEDLPRGGSGALEGSETLEDRETVFKEKYGEEFGGFALDYSKMDAQSTGVGVGEFMYRRKYARALLEAINSQPEGERADWIAVLFQNQRGVMKGSSENGKFELY